MNLNSLADITNQAIWKDVKADFMAGCLTKDEFIRQAKEFNCIDNFEIINTIVERKKKYGD